jgi:DNA-binding NarL/FixJ family response regulator
MSENLRPYVFVEDTASDYEAAQRGLRRLGVEAPTVWCEGIGSAEDYLLSAQGPPPGLIILDLRLPDGDGTEILRLVRGDARLRHVPVAIWSASEDPAEIETCYRHGADIYMTKAASRDVFGESIQRFADMWKPET